MSGPKPTRGRAALAPLLAATMLAGFAAAPARADDLTAEDAQALEQDFRGWLSAITGPHLDLGQRPVQFTAEGDHYKLDIPYAGALGATGVAVDGPPISALVKPLDGGRWELTEIRTPSPLHISFPATGPEGISDVKITIDEQDQHAVLDPSLTSASNWDSTIKGYTSTMAGPNGNGTRSTHLAKMVTHLSWQPSAGGRIDVLQDSEGNNLTSSQVMPDVGLVSFAADKLHVSAHVDGIAPDRVPTIFHAVMDMVPLAMAAAQQAATDTPAADAPATDAPAPAAPTADAPASAAATGDKKLTPAQKASMHAAVLALTELLNGFDEKGSIENVRLEAAGHSGKAKKLSGGLGIGAPDGKLALHFNIAIDGLDSAEIPKGPLHTYVPKHFSIAPRVGGVPAEDLKSLLMRAVDSEGDDPALQGDAMALLQKGPIVVGLDEVAFDFGPAKLKGTAEVLITGPDPDTYSAVAHFAISGMDALLKQAGTVPELKEAGPVLIMMKGIGQQDGANTVWDIVYKNKQVFVNGNDMSQLIPH